VCEARYFYLHFPDAVQRASGAPQIRDRCTLEVCKGPGSAAHHIVLALRPGNELTSCSGDAARMVPRGGSCDFNYFNGLLSQPVAKSSIVLHSFLTSIPKRRDRLARACSNKSSMF